MQTKLCDTNLLVAAAFVRLRPLKRSPFRRIVKKIVSVESLKQNGNGSQKLEIFLSLIFLLSVACSGKWAWRIYSSRASLARRPETPHRLLTTSSTTARGIHLFSGKQTERKKAKTKEFRIKEGVLTLANQKYLPRHGKPRKRKKKHLMIKRICNVSFGGAFRSWR